MAIRRKNRYVHNEHQIGNSSRGSDEVREPIGDVRIVEDLNEVISDSCSRSLGSEHTFSPHGPSGESAGFLAEETATAHKVFDTMPLIQSESPVTASGIHFGDSSKNTGKPLWSTLFKDNRDTSQGFKLEKFDFSSSFVTLDDSDIDDIEDKWGFCLIGHFVAKSPGAFILKEVSKRWKVPSKFLIHKSGWIVFKFENEGDRDKVLQEGPYSIFGKTLILKPLPKCFEFEAFELLSIPVWATLPGLPLDFWNAKCLGKIMSKVGSPIATDKLTQSKIQISYARVLVEVDLSKDIVNSVEIKMPNGRARVQPILFEKLPKVCVKCKQLGHVSQDCGGSSGGKQHEEVTGKGIDPSIIGSHMKKGAHIHFTSPVDVNVETAAAGISLSLGQSPVGFELPATTPVNIGADFTVVTGRNKRAKAVQFESGSCSVQNEKEGQVVTIPTEDPMTPVTMTAGNQNSLVQHRHDSAGKFVSLKNSVDKLKGVALPLSTNSNIFLALNEIDRDLVEDTLGNKSESVLAIETNKLIAKVCQDKAGTSLAEGLGGSGPSVAVAHSDLVVHDNKGSGYLSESGGVSSCSPIGWGHKIVMVDELDRKKHKKAPREGKVSRDLVSQEVLSSLFHVGLMEKESEFDLSSEGEGYQTPSMTGMKGLKMEEIDKKRVRKSKGKKKKKGSRGSLS